MAFDWTKIADPFRIVTNDYNDPSKAALPDINAIEGKVSPLYQPAINAGNSAMPGYQDIMQKLLSNPQEFINMLGKGYQKSPGYDFNLQQSQGGINNAAAAGGMLGTPEHQFKAGANASDFANNDFNGYMDRILKGLGLGAAGTEGIINRGQTASSSLADKIAEILGTKAGLKYNGAMGENINNTANKQNLVNFGMKAAGSGGMF